MLISCYNCSHDETLKDLCRGDLSFGMDLVSVTNFNEWEGFIIGTPECPFEGGRFKLSIVFPADCKKVQKTLCGILV
jgi:ubiquitin-protein ligase